MHGPTIGQQPPAVLEIPGAAIGFLGGKPVAVAINRARTSVPEFPDVLRRVAERAAALKDSFDGRSYHRVIAIVGFHPAKEHVAVNQVGVRRHLGSFRGLQQFVEPVTYSGKVGNTIEFLGQNFTASTTVFFNGTPATATVKSATYLTAEVPSGATTGFVTVTTSASTLTSNRTFRVIP
jgi:hypothetical protein